MMWDWQHQRRERKCIKAKNDIIPTALIIEPEATSSVHKPTTHLLIIALAAIYPAARRHEQHRRDDYPYILD